MFKNIHIRMDTEETYIFEEAETLGAYPTGFLVLLQEGTVHMFNMNHIREYNYEEDGEQSDLSESDNVIPLN